LLLLAGLKEELGGFAEVLHLCFDLEIPIDIVLED
jgi:hypothetical protein